jgi:SAM-dependent methyltransferase
MGIHEDARRGFQSGAVAYERGRPGYPAGAIEWLWAELDLRPGRTVLDVGAGTGKLTRELVSSGAEVVAVEPVPGMRGVLERAVPRARVLDGTAEALPVADRSVDAIAVAQAFHWFDVPRALAEFHRVLRPGGRFALIWNRRRLDQPLHHEIHRIIEPYHGDTPSHQRGAWREPVARSGQFAQVGELELPTEQELDVDGVVDRVASTSFIAALDEPERVQVLERVRELAVGWAGPLRLGYTTEAYVHERV